MRYLDVGSWIGEAAGDAARIHDRSFARSPPRIVLGEVATFRLTMRIPSSKFGVVVFWVHQAHRLTAKRSWIKIFAGQSAR
jgi:hypothetical protein